LQLYKGLVSVTPSLTLPSSPAMSPSLRIGLRIPCLTVDIGFRAGRYRRHSIKKLPGNSRCGVDWKAQLNVPLWTVRVPWKRWLFYSSYIGN